MRGITYKRNIVKQYIYIISKNAYKKLYKSNILCGLKKGTSTISPHEAIKV
jgi:hypothetical protein